MSSMGTAMLSYADLELGLNEHQRHMRNTARRLAALRGVGADAVGVTLEDSVLAVALWRDWILAGEQGVPPREPRALREVTEEERALALRWLQRTDAEVSGELSEQWPRVHYTARRIAALRQGLDIDARVGVDREDQVLAVALWREWALIPSWADEERESPLARLIDRGELELREVTAEEREFAEKWIGKLADEDAGPPAAGPR
jgi:hypothetical protein